MTEQRPDTDERHEPGGTPSPGPDDLTVRPAVPGIEDGGGASKAVPGTYEADDGARERAEEVEPGN